LGWTCHLGICCDGCALPMGKWCGKWRHTPTWRHGPIKLPFPPYLCHLPHAKLHLGLGHTWPRCKWQLGLGSTRSCRNSSYWKLKFTCKKNKNP
jgi:hypothetical protein